LLRAWDRGRHDRAPAALADEYRAWLAAADVTAGGRPEANELRRAGAQLRRRAGLVPGPCFAGTSRELVHAFEQPSLQ